LIFFIKRTGKAIQCISISDYYGAKVSLTDEVWELIKQLTELNEIPLPVGIQVTLQPYQHRSYSWMY
jgi:hypothetical protein